jgi:hypothetical protein
MIARKANPKSLANLKVGGSPGRPKGVPNGVTGSAREAFQAVFNVQIPFANEWFKRAAKTNPAKALELLLSLGEHFVPKLNRTELVGAGGEKLSVSIVINGIKKDSNE